MLNEDPNDTPNDAFDPADLPVIDEPAYAAASRLVDANPVAAQPFSSPMPPTSPSPSGGGRARGWVAGLAVAAVVLAVALGAWYVSSRPSQPSALPTSTSTPATSGTPTTSSSPQTSTAPGPAASTSLPVPASTDHPAQLDRYYTQTIRWEPCSDTPRHQCGTMLVPVDYATPDGDTFELALRKVPATKPDERIGSLLINPGGPGGSGVEYAQYATYVFSPQLLAAYDIVGFDPRGIGASSPVACLTDADMDLLFKGDPTPDSPAEKQELLDDSREVVRSCAAKGGERALHMSTAEVARDMDILRALLGDPKLNYLGVSYGTFLGAMYADLFPAKVGRMVLDSAMSPNQTDEQEMTYDIQGFESSFQAFADWCVTQDSCALGTDPAKAGDKLVALLDQVERSPLRTNKPGLATIGEGWVGFAIFMCLYSSDSWSTLNRGLEEAISSGRGDVLLTKAFSVVSRKSNGTYDTSTYLQAMLPVRCADWPHSTDDAAIEATRERLGAAHPVWSRLTGVYYDMCVGWPGTGRTPTGTTLGAGAAPILVIGNLRDPATPIGGTEQLAKDLASGVLVTVDHDGHGAYFSGNACADRIVDDYLVDGDVPTNATTC